MRTILIMLAFCANAFASDLPDLGESTQCFYGWNKKEMAKEAAFGVLMLVDYRQTMDIKTKCAPRQVTINDGATGSGITMTRSDNDRCFNYETNPFLGKHPSDARIRNYFAGTMLAHVVIVPLLPTDWRNYVQNGSIIFQGFVVGRNAYLGLSTNF